MKKILSLVFLLAFFSCSDPDDDMPNNFVIDNHLEFTVFNNQGEDLLNPKTQNHFTSNQIKLIYKINGENKEVYDPNMDYPKNFLIYEHEKEYRLRVFLNDSDNEKLPITYIQWEEKDIDTVKVSYKKGTDYLIKNQIWLNDQLVWERDNNDEFYIKMIK